MRRREDISAELTMGGLLACYDELAEAVEAKSNAAIALSLQRNQAAPKGQIKRGIIRLAKARNRVLRLDEETAMYPVQILADALTCVEQIPAEERTSGQQLLSREIGRLLDPKNGVMAAEV